jgi:hypothetical protein
MELASGRRTLKPGDGRHLCEQETSRKLLPDVRAYGTYSRGFDRRLPVLGSVPFDRNAEIMLTRCIVRSGLPRIQRTMKTVATMSEMPIAAAGQLTMVTAVAAAVAEASLVTRTTTELF